MAGVYENYLTQKMPDPNMIGITEALEWFCFSDRIHRYINQYQNYSVYGYLQFGFVIWHFLFATMAWPKITFPVKGYEVRTPRFNFDTSMPSVCAYSQTYTLKHTKHHLRHIKCFRVLCKLNGFQSLESFFPLYKTYKDIFCVIALKANEF